MDIKENFYSNLQQLREGSYATTKLGRVKRKVGRALGLGKKEARRRADDMGISSLMDRAGSKESVHGKELQDQMKKSADTTGRASKRYLRISQGKKPFGVNEEQLDEKLTDIKGKKSRLRGAEQRAKERDKHNGRLERLRGAKVRSKERDGINEEQLDELSLDARREYVNKAKGGGKIRRFFVGPRRSSLEGIKGSADTIKGEIERSAKNPGKLAHSDSSLKAAHKNLLAKHTNRSAIVNKVEGQLQKEQLDERTVMSKKAKKGTKFKVIARNPDSEGSDVELRQGKRRKMAGGFYRDTQEFGLLPTKKGKIDMKGKSQYFKSRKEILDTVSEEQLDEISHKKAREAEDKAAEVYHGKYDDETDARKNFLRNKTPENKKKADDAGESRKKAAKRVIRFQKYADKKKEKLEEVSAELANRAYKGAKNKLLDNDIMVSMTKGSTQKKWMKRSDKRRNQAVKFANYADKKTYEAGKKDK
jgi:hypothetical protein